MTGNDYSSAPSLSPLRSHQQRHRHRHIQRKYGKIVRAIGLKID